VGDAHRSSILLAAAVGVVSFPLAAPAVEVGTPTERAMTDGIVALQAEVMLLVALDGYADPVPGALTQVHDRWSSYGEGMDRTDLIRWLGDADSDGRRALDDLVAAGITPPPDLDVALGPLSSEVMSDLAAGEPTQLDPAPYVGALHILEDGRIDEVATSPADSTFTAPGSVAASITPTSADTTPKVSAVVAEEPTSAPTASDGAGLVPQTQADDAGITVLSVAGAAAVVSTVAAMTGRRRRRRTSDSGFDRLLEAGRRMTKALERDEIAHIAMTEAMRLADAAHGAFVSVSASGLELLIASEDIFDGRRLGEGLFQRIADTGQPVNVVSHDEPALTALPVAMLGVPVLGAGRVMGILTLIRPDHRPFAAREDAIVSRLAPMVGSALAAAERHDGITALSFVDPLTALPNRRSLDRDIIAALASPGPVAVAMIDVDHFKNFNDTNGHAAGDEALKVVGRALAAGLRSSDRAYRYGGEEFSLLLRVRDVDDAVQVCERIRHDVENTAIAGERHQPGGRLTISIGVAIVQAGQSALPAEAALQAADTALYTAKEAGRNTVVVTEPVRV
jgi:diguanylate cyclase (GGDEF)-like protein